MTHTTDTMKGGVAWNSATERHEGMTINGHYFVSVGPREFEIARRRLEETGGLDTAFGAFALVSTDGWKRNLESWVDGTHADRPRPDILVTEVATSVSGAP